MIKIASYYYDRETAEIKVDQKFDQSFGKEHNGVEIKPNTTYVFTFEYYCTKDIDNMSAVLKTLYTHYEKPNQYLWQTFVSRMNRNRRGKQLLPGRQSFYAEFTTAENQTDFLLGFEQGSFGDTYIWDIKLAEKGSDKNLFPNANFIYGFKYWNCPRKVSDSREVTDQIQILPPDEEMMSLGIGEFLPDRDFMFYVANSPEFQCMPKEPVCETPFALNAAVLYNPQHSSADNAGEAKRLEVVNAPDTVKPSGKTVYVSNNGDDKNDGLSPDTAWRTLQKLNNSCYDTVLFERGGVYRGMLQINSDKNYGAYGTGYKPTFYTGGRNFASENLWEKTSVPNIWAANVGEVADIGNIIFDHGKKCGTKMLYTYKNLSEDFEFYHHLQNNTLYLYYSKGNPAKDFYSIEIATGNSVHGDLDVKNVVIENLCVKYSGFHGISFRAGADNIVIRGCEIGYIGGSITGCGGYGRLGNGIEFVNSYSNTLVENCWIYQCYDTGYSFQNCSGEYRLEDNMVLRDSLLEYSTMNIEIFTGRFDAPKKPNVTNVRIYDNIIRFGGYGWGFNNRMGSNNLISSNFNIYKGCGNAKYSCTDFVVEDNIFDGSYYALLDVGWPNHKGRGPTIRNNTYIQKNNDKQYAVWVKGTDDNENGGLHLEATDQKTFEESIRKADLSPKAVILE